MTEARFYALVVTYNVFCGDSLTCGALAALEDPSVGVLVYDNSTKDFGNRAYCAERNWTYLGGDGNKGLSVAYNGAVDFLKSSAKDGFLCLFDDDTAVDCGYFSALRTACSVFPEAKIFVPLIYSAQRLLSPSRLGKSHQTSLFSSEEQALGYQGADLTAINSGMALSLSLFESYRYDENIFLDGVDHSFLEDMKRNGERIHVFPFRCDQNFSGDERPSKESALNRFRIFARDYRYIFRNRKRSYRFLVGKRALRLALRYRSFSFFRHF